jgi:hypothetical protein
MTNTLVTCSIVAKESLAVLKNMCKFASACNRDWEDEFTGNMSRGYAPARPSTSRSPRATLPCGPRGGAASHRETTVPLTLSQGGCDLNFTSLASAPCRWTKLEDKLQAAMATVVNEIDRQGLQLARLSTFNQLGTPGTAPNTRRSLSQP